MVSVERESWFERVRRRLVTVPGYVVMAATFTSLLPLLVVVAALVDLMRDRRFPLVRFLLLIELYLLCEIAGMIAAFALWCARAGRIVSPARYFDLNHSLEALWASSLLRGVRAVFGMTIEVRGAEALQPGPVLVLVRHASMADTLLPAALLSFPLGLQLRYVLKSELLWDPCLDIVGQRIPNAFVRRGARARERETDAVRALARDLGPREGVLIFPEGTRFSKRKLAERLEQLQSDEERLARVGGMTHVLPVKVGGALALLETAPEVDVAIMRHIGLDGVASFQDTIDGSLIGRRITVEIERIPAANIPTRTDDRVRWLDEAWIEIDGWVESQLGS